MGNSSNDLWTPDGDVSTKERNVVEISTQDMEIIARMHAVAQKLGIALVCMRCDKSFEGKNSETGSVWRANCGCRELKAGVRRGVVV